MTSRSILWPVLAALALGGAGCAAMLPAPRPMRAVDGPRAAGEARCLLVLLPGMGDRPETFRAEGFLERLERRGLDADVVVADATLGYYAKGHMPGQLWDDVIAPRLRPGQRLWLLGISMGGMGALMTAHDHPVAGLVLLAPYLGDEALVDEIRAAGGLAPWAPGDVAGPLTEERFQRQVWAWAKGAVASGGPPVALGFGAGDRSAHLHRVLAAALPPERVRTAPGGHDWEAWRALLDDVLARSPLVDECGGATATGR